ncbi:MAG TPA: VWA domain-containing protein [Gemmatimonadaceae bacterium]|nr:VWA domain-containing protein [Gemmatimonadaceae bacterium]
MIPFVDKPYALILAPVLTAAVIWLLLAAYRNREKRLQKLGSPDVISRLVPPTARRRPWPRVILLSLAALCAGIAFAGPRWGLEAAVVRGSGADVVLALDASLSMLGTDERPNRLQRMKQEARRLLAASSGDRFGLIAFAGRSYILTPLTVDRGALELFLDNLDPSVVGQAGSSLARTMRQGTDLLLSSNTASDRALVIMSDGEAFEPAEDVAAAAKRAADAGIVVVTVGFGTEQGSQIPIRTGNGTTFKRDENGEIVVTRYSPEMLESAATAAGGTFIEAGATDKAARVRRALSQLRRVGRAAEAGRDRKPRFQLFLIPAVFFVLLDTLLAERRGRRRPAAAAATPAAAALLLFALAFPPPLRADEGADGDKLFRAGRYAEAAEAYKRAIDDGNASARLLYNYGTALILAGKADDAVQPLERVSSGTKDLDLRYRALFNLGLVYLNRGRALKEEEAATQAYAAALEAYKRALRLRPNETDAKWNYELALRERPPESGGGGGGGGDQQPQPAAPQPSPSTAQRPSGGLDQQRAEQLLNSAAREERDVQSRKQQQRQPERPPGGKDW